MRWLNQLRMQFLMLFHRRRAAASLDEELQFHLDRQIAENLAAGMPPDEARYAALRTIGNPALLRDEARATWSWNWLEGILRELRYGVRTLSRTPGFSLIAIIVMALCIGAATSLFTIVRSVLLRPLPFRDPGQLVMVYEHFTDQTGSVPYNVVSPADFYDWRTQTHGFEDMAACRGDQFNLTGEHGEFPEVIQAGAGTWNLIPLLGIQPAFGRSFNESEDHPGGNAVMLTWTFFERRFGGNPAIVGKQIHLDSKPYTVVGILPREFTYPNAKIQIWIPYGADVTPEFLQYHDHHQTRVVARLKPGVSLASAIGQVKAVQYHLHMQYLHSPVADDVLPRSITDDLAQDVKTPLIVLMCAVGCMLLIGCLNVANLLVARAAARQKEVAIRTALGAQRFTLISGQLIESFLICIVGGTAGIGLSLVATNWLARTWKDLPSAQSIHIDGEVLAFSCGLVFAAALLAGLLPAISSTGKAVFSMLQSSSRSTAGSASRTALRKVLLSVEITVTVVLLIAAGLLLKSFLHLRTTNIGCTTDNVLTLGYSLPAQKYDKPEQVNAFNEALLDRLRAIPGVRGVALGTVLPGAGRDSDDIFSVPEHPPVPAGHELPDALNRDVAPGFFSALQIPLISGRFFTSQDRAGQPSRIIISNQLAHQYFPGENPIGKHMRAPAHKAADYEVIGVVGDTLWHADQPAKPTMYFPLLEGDSNTDLMLAVRTTSDPRAMAVPVQKEIAALDPQLPVHDVLTLEQVIGESLVNASFSATLVLAFAILSLTLASVGLYGVLSYLMTQRMTEIGVRIALGAQREQVLRLMLLDGLRPALIGLVFGLAASAAVTRQIQSMLFGTEPLDPIVFAGVAASLLFVSALACLVPAWRASRLDPMQALRID